MACFAGRNGVIKTGTGTPVVYTAVAQLTSYNINETADTAECTHFDTGGFREYKTTFRSWEVSADMVWNRQDADLTVGSEVAIEVYPEGDAVAGTDWIISGAVAIITSMDITAATEDNVSASVTLQGSGALTRAGTG
jgi:predicted secreted protein